MAKWSRRLKFLIAFLIPVAGVMICNNGLDNDSWYILAEGREIVENGVYYEDQLSMHEGLNVTVQNYGFAAIFYLLYSALGGTGIYLIMLILNIVLCYLIYKICRLISHKNESLSLLLMILTDLLLSYGYVVTRAQMVSYIIMMLVIYILELYAREGKKKSLWWIPILSLVQINLHASLWPMILIVMAVYIIDGFKQPKLHYKGYKIRPLILVGLISFAVGFLNPYGFKMMTFILTSYGVPEANNYINELSPFSLTTGYNILLYATIVAVLILYIFGKNRNIRLRYLLLLFGFLALGLNTVKGMSHLILVLLFPLAEVYSGIKMNNPRWRKLRFSGAIWAGVLALVVVVATTTIIIPNTNARGPSDVMIYALDALDEKVGDMDKSKFKVYGDYDEGGYVEYRGYKSYVDPRMEVFLKANNGKEDIFSEFYSLQHGDLDKAEFLKKYDFDFLVIREYDKLYNSVDENEYELVYHDDEAAEYDGVKVYRKKTNEEGYIKI